MQYHRNFNSVCDGGLIFIIPLMVLNISVVVLLFIKLIARQSRAKFGYEVAISFAPKSSRAPTLFFEATS